MRRSIDLNADLGEGLANDAAMMAEVSSCNIACGGHAGDAETMRTALRLSRRHGVRAGAHPSYPDREGFGRRAMEVPASALEATLTEQVEHLRALAAEEGVTLTHLKPHGALYNAAAKDGPLALLLARLNKRLLPGAALVGPPGSELSRAAEAEGVPFLAEGFVDRSYEADGSLTPRGEPGAVIEEEDARIAQALAMAKGEPVTARGGEGLALSIDTLCLHGDSPGAEGSARALRRAIEAAGITVGPARG